jgi:glucoamylase
MQDMTSGLGMVPEQAWEDPAVAASPFGSDPATASIGFTNGKPAGSASPLIWAQAQYLRLVTDLGSGSLGDQPAIVADRYVRHAPPASLTVTATATATGGQITVSGTARAGSRGDLGGLCHAVIETAPPLAGLPCPGGARGRTQASTGRPRPGFGEIHNNMI